MKNFLAKWWPIVIMLISGLLAAGKITATQAYIIKQLNSKVDQSQFDESQTLIIRELDRIYVQLRKIEDKIDGFNASRH